MTSNPKSSVKYPSSINFVQFPVFALAWHSSPVENSFCSVLAYAGGGGSAKTGVQNAIHVTIIILTQDGIDTHKRTVCIDTGDSIGVSVTIFRRPVWSWVAQDDPYEIWIAAGVGDEVRLYSIPLLEDTNTTDDFMMLTSFNFPKSSHAGVNTVAVNASRNLLAIGCESGIVSICVLERKPSSPSSTIEIPTSATYHLLRTIDLTGHVKAVCSVRFHPRSDTIVLSSGKDGTCRLWDVRAETCLYVMSCKIYDPKLPPPTNPSILNPNPGQLLVRGCAFGDEDGRKIYTIQSGRKGQAFLSVWILQILPPQEEDIGEIKQDSGVKSSSSPSPRITFQEISRIPVSQYPVSAVDISGDFSMLVLGDTNGSVTLFSTSNLKPIKSWVSVHDLPVTCVAARPLREPLTWLPGERIQGIHVDAMSVSADNKLTSLTLLRKAVLVTPKLREKQDQGSRSGVWSLIIHLFVFVIILSWAMKISYDTCEDLFASGQSWSDAFDCVIHDVWWAPRDRPGISFIVH